MNGKTGALTQIWPQVRLGIVCSDKGIPMVTFAAIFARGSPEDLATNGADRVILELKTASEDEALTQLNGFANKLLR